MKILSKLLLVGLCSLLIITCNKKEPTKPPTKSKIPKIEIDYVDSISAHSAHCYLLVSDHGASPIIEKGLYIGLNTYYYSPSSAKKIIDSSANDDLDILLQNLRGSNKYYIKPFATNADGTYLGTEKIFTTEPGFNLPEVVTYSGINANSNSVEMHGGLLYEGSASVNNLGFCWSTSKNPTIQNDFRTAKNNGIGSIILTIHDLKPTTTYYVRTFATNSGGTSYGENITVTTLASVGLATLSTVTADYITRNEAYLIGKIITGLSGGISSYGFCVSKFSNPSYNDIVVSGVNNSKLPDIEAIASGLDANTTYYYRTYAINSNGIGYGDILSFKTLDANTYGIGQQHNGGFIFYVDGTGKHGLIADYNDISNVYGGWGCTGNDIKGTSTAVGNGASNTDLILKYCTSKPNAANFCLINRPSSGYIDWFLPSKDELNLLYQNLNKHDYGRFSIGQNYLSSSQSDINHVWHQVFDTGAVQSEELKSKAGRIRAVRAF